MNINRSTCYKHSLIILLVTMSGFGLRAQEIRVPQSEFSFYMKGPFAKLSFDLGDYGESSSRFGVGFGAQYARYLDYHWSVSGGLEIQTYASKAVMPAFSDSYATTDMEGDDFEFQYSVSSYYERENLTLLNVPIKVQYETGVGKTVKFFSSAGFAVGFPIGGNYKSRITGLKTAGYYPQWDALLTSPKFAGFGNWGNQHSAKMDLNPKNSYAFLLEVGIKHNLAEGHNFYGGLFIDIPLNKINNSDNNNQSMIAYDADNPGQLIYNPVVYASPGAQGDGYADKMKAFAWGFKLRYAIDY
ncbi:porin family protein [Mangrovibacterium lignilyticum]|uniref:hypothetical protein n=1 Tax=Mangrovibacterium lignilyticum TaxID=2668052 RepID=UPI0013CFAB68|nr:hypothetical protein [Mangrovibacterium lignilyticum]